MINKKQFTCTKNGRLDEILAEHLQLSRSQAQKYIKQGVEIDGKKAEFIEREKGVIEITLNRKEGVITIYRDEK